MKALTFNIKQEFFSIDIKCLKEIKPFNDLKNTYVPNAPTQLRGLVNLRGSLVPVLDLGVTLDINGAEDKELNVIILSIAGRTIGVLVGPIGNILEIQEGELESPPSSTKGVDSKYVSGVKRFEDKLLVHLEPERLININQTGEYN